MTRQCIHSVPCVTTSVASIDHRTTSLLLSLIQVDRGDVKRLETAATRYREYKFKARCVGGPRSLSCEGCHHRRAGVVSSAGARPG
jgi:hypothetical protein